MNIYARKRQWKWLLLSGGLIIFLGTLYFTNVIVNKIATEERKNLRLWADAVNRKASLVKYTEDFFAQIKEEERRRVETLAEAYRRLIQSEQENDLTFYLRLIENNKTIPVVLTDENYHILSTNNLEGHSTSKWNKDSLTKHFGTYPPITVHYIANKYHFLFYRDSRLFSELQDVLNDLNQSFINEVVANSASVPVLITDSAMTKIIASGNIDTSLAFPAVIGNILGENKPITVNLSEHGTCLVLYKDSFLLTQLRYFPFIQLIIIGLFLVISYFVFSWTRKSEQDQVWVGMSKETAHQLGTPLSSMMAWIEVMKLDGLKHEALDELQNDIDRLEVITERFSKIGSKPQLQIESLANLIRRSMTYLRARTSSRVEFDLQIPEGEPYLVPLNANLFEWVIENLTKNAVDAMEGHGRLSIRVTEDPKQIYIDFSDTGKGIHKGKFKAIFNPGYTSKKRGWGLGLSLSKRIVEMYHKGYIYVKHSQAGTGTTFRIVLKK
ncbi:MAG: HAMP domain-containing sensor histidine kinase [Bacteroidales bacterium]|nr:HAMP domain-containing sensor histidine kinase [Bacteroidales bacterium]